MILDLVAMAETDVDAPDSWNRNVGTYRCSFEGESLFECWRVWSLPMEFVAHMQEYHQDVDHDESI